MKSSAMANVTTGGAWSNERIARENVCAVCHGALVERWRAGGWVVECAAHPEHQGRISQAAASARDTDEMLRGAEFRRAYAQRFGFKIASAAYGSGALYGGGDDTDDNGGDPMIKGMTDRESITPRFPRLGKLRKGGERIKARNKKGEEVWRMGPDLDHFRFVAEGNSPEVAAIFAAAFGPEPRAINVYLPYRSPEDCFPTWCEVWGKSGLVHRCDGETMTLWREGSKMMSGAQPCAGGHKDNDYRNDAVGRLQLVIPELIEAGYVGYVVLETHGKHDCVNITSVLRATYDATPRQDLRGIPFILRRSQENISVPGWGDRADQRSRADKWLVRLEPVADWTRLALEAAKYQALQLQAPRGELAPGPDDVEGEYTVEDDTDFNEPRFSDEDEPEGDGDPGQAAATGQSTITVQTPLPAQVAATSSPAASRWSNGRLVGGMIWCEWCGERPSAPGIPCNTCEQLGATPESRPGPQAQVSKPNAPAATGKPAASKPAAPNGTASIERPLAPDKLRDFITKKAMWHANNGHQASDKQRGLCAGALEMVWAGDEHARDKRKTVMVYLTNYDTLSAAAPGGMPDDFVLALLDWLKPTKEQDSSYMPDPMAAKEARLVEHEAAIFSDGAPLQGD